ncbi:GNAT family N-acetyltransferase [soil metagenome]
MARNLALHGPLAFDGAAVDQPAVAAAAGIDIAIATDLDAIAADWRFFEWEADRTFFQSFDWLAKWQHHVGAPGGTRPAIVTGRERGGNILFIFPLAVEGGGFTRRLTWLASPVCDYNGPLLARKFWSCVGSDGFPALWRTIVRRLRASGLRFDFIDLSKMPEAVGGQPNPFLKLPVRVNPSNAYVATLGDSWEAWYSAKRSGPTRKKERKQLKQLGEHGAVKFVDVAGTELLRETMATLIAQKLHAFARMGVRNQLDQAAYHAFYLDLANDPATRDIEHISRLDVGDVPAATGLGLRYGGTYYLVLSSYQDGELARLGPGRAHLNELLRHAIGQGFQRFDFTIGDEPYKRDYSDIVLRPHDHIAAVTGRGALVVGAKIAFRRAKRFIKQTPALWQGYLKARALVAAWSGRGKGAAAGEGDA